MVFRLSNCPAGGVSSAGEPGYKASSMKTLANVLVALIVSGCAALLPGGRQETVAPWHSFAEAKAAYDRIEPYATKVSDLHGLGYDPGQTPNVTILNYSQVIKTAVPQPSFSVDDQPPGIRDCIRAESRCIGYALEESQIKRKRVGNFFLDFLNFDRETLISGWRFNALVVIVDGTVVYKQWSGQPMVKQVERNRNPLGPFQGSGSEAARNLVP